MRTTITIEIPVGRDHELVDRIFEYAMDEAEKLGFDAFVASQTDSKA